MAADEPPLTRRSLLVGAAAALALPAPDGGHGGPTTRQAGTRPRAWGDRLPGIVSALPVTARGCRGPRRPLAALTFDGCGNPPGGASGYDADLIGVLRRFEVPATLFLSGRWIAENPSLARDLAADPLFELGNHGTRHVPLSVTGRSAYGIRGTGSAAEAVAEVWTNATTLTRITGRPPLLFRPGTACYDDVGVAITRELGLIPTGYTVNGDSGATAPAAVVERRLLSLRPGGIVLSHLNHPRGQTAEGVARALPRLLRAGWVFVRVGDLVA